MSLMDIEVAPDKDGVALGLPENFVKAPQVVAPRQPVEESPNIADEPEDLEAKAYAETAAILGVTAMQVMSLKPRNRKDYSSGVDMAGILRYHGQRRGGAMVAAAEIITSEGILQKEIITDEGRQPYSEDVTIFLGLQACASPPSECISFVPEKL